MWRARRGRGQGNKAPDTDQSFGGQSGGRQDFGRGNFRPNFSRGGSSRGGSFRGRDRSFGQKVGCILDPDFDAERA